MIVVLPLWPGLAAALALGLGVGALAGFPRTRATQLGASLPLLALAALVGLAATGTVPGRAGLRIEIATLVLAAYLAGCAFSALGRTLVRRQS
ncbi:hypothetical protein ASG52_07565 [Methylobacterium sp. Leaf456]|uniref:hypothetical protein n=1 Tax=Methylobacterium sp. Leaf456 TaxID=1736382 RepID=UPI0006F3E0E3|nr:hypothetical protein [Methylobacterium sp. Leaf456]KQT49937.1 hypothetical protein ASG52_07565 [Methylobacterium sp. Leaf456]